MSASSSLAKSFIISSFSCLIEYTMTKMNVAYIVQCTCEADMEENA